ncbi:MAG: S1C family serine protease [Acidimicrobiales bacterium]
MDLDGGDLEGGSDGIDPHRGWVHPDDRLWRHPSETATATPRRPTGQGRRYLAWSRPTALILAAGTAGVLVGAQLHFGQGGLGSDPTGLSAQPVVETTTIPQARAGRSVMRMASQVAPAMAAISATTPSGKRRAYGLVYRPGNLIVTTDATVEHATSVTVATSTGVTFPATVVGHDAQTGVAVVKVLGAEMAPAPMSPGTGVQVGQLAFTVDFGQWPAARPSLAVGTVLATGRPSVKHDGSMVPNAIETDTPQDPSDPYGVLINQAGQVVGLESGYAMAGSNRRWLAIPISLAIRVADELVHTGRVVHGWLGVMGPTSGATGIPGGHDGVTVTSVEPNSPAARAGLVPGDMIVSADLTKVSSYSELQALIRCLPPGSSLDLSVLRQNSPQTMVATLAADSG